MLVDIVKRQRLLEIGAGIDLLADHEVQVAERPVSDNARRRIMGLGVSDELLGRVMAARQVAEKGVVGGQTP